MEVKKDISSHIPEDERWLYQGDNLKNLDGAIEWAESHPRRDNFDEIAEKIEKLDAVEELSALSNRKINLTDEDALEITNWDKAVVGKFYRPEK